jgi:hypothetical protein
MTDGYADEIKALASIYKKKTEQTSADTARQIEDQKTIQLEAPKLWAKLRQQIKDNVDGFNLELGRTAISWDDIHSDRIAMTRVDDGLKLEGGFDASISTAFFRCLPAKIDLTLTTTVQFGIVEFAVIDRNTTPIHVKMEPDVANGLLRDFVMH